MRYPKKILGGHETKKVLARKASKTMEQGEKPLALWISKTSFLEQQLNKNAEQLIRMCGRMLADCLCED